MKTIQLPLPVLGLDVVSAETELPKGAVRSAQNVVLSDQGGIRRAKGSVLRGALAGAHSLWRGATATLTAAGNTLYEVTLGNPTTYESIFTGLPVEEPVEYDVAALETYFTAGGVLGKLCADGLVRRPGVAELIGNKPTLSLTVGGLYEGRYGIAYSLTNDLGEESPLSSIAYIDVPEGGGGVLITNTVEATDAVTLNVYITAANGMELYLNQSIPWATATSIRDQRLGRQATKLGRVVMPGGKFVRYWHGRLWVAVGGFLIFSDPNDYGVTDPKAGWMNVGPPVTMFEPVEGGLFVGTADRTVFYRGSGPEDLKVATVSAHGAVEHSGARAKADFFDPKLIGDASLPVAVWLSEVGLTVGTADGRMLPVQAERIRLAADGPARAALVWNDGIRQAIFSVESMTMGVGSSADGTQ